MMSSGRSAPRANGSPDQDVVQRASSRSRSQGLLEWACSPHTHANLRIPLIATANNVVQCCRTNWLNSYRGRLRSDGGLNLRRVMSALPPKADIDRACRDVRFLPKADVGVAIESPR